MQDIAKRLDRGLNAGTAAAAGHRLRLAGHGHADEPPLASVDRGYGDNSRFSRDVEKLMLQLNDTARSLRALADLLTRHPEALIKGRASQGVQ